MLSKIFSCMIIIVVLYILGIFFSPNLTDSISDMLGIAQVNTTIRNLKSWADSTSETLLQIKDASGAINGVQQVVNQANEKIEKTAETINTIRQVGEQKVEQVQKTVDSFQKTGEAINELQWNISELTSLSGSVSASGSVK